VAEDIEARAQIALGWVRTTGIDGFGVKNPLQYGLDHGLYTQEEVDAAQRQFELSRKLRR
jgi:hypothetical protein